MSNGFFDLLARGVRPPALRAQGLAEFVGAVMRRILLDQTVLSAVAKSLHAFIPRFDHHQRLQSCR
jgi:hypothetical protein